MADVSRADGRGSVGDGFRPAMVASVHTAGDFLRWNPHIHALTVRGGWLDGEWRPVPIQKKRLTNLRKNA